MLDILCENADHVYTVKVDPRGEDPEVLAEGARKRGTEAAACENVQKAIEEAFSRSGLNDVVCCAGSLYLSGDVRKLMREKKIEWKSLP